MKCKEFRGKDFDFLDDLSWQGKYGGSSRSDADLTIGKNKSGWGITIRNGFQKKIGTHIMLAVKDDSIFFKADPKGYKLCFTKKTPEALSNGYLKIAGNYFKPSLNDFIGDYTLHYFEPLNLYYISKESNNE